VTEAGRRARFLVPHVCSIGEIIVIVGVILIFVWSFCTGLIIALVGLVFFGGLARGRWY
jgi:hypothetical protein